MGFDYSRLKGRIVEKYGSRRNFAREFPISERSLSLKLNNRIDFDQSDIQRACIMLDIADPDIPSYFFTLIAQNN